MVPPPGMVLSLKKVPSRVHIWLRKNFIFENFHPQPSTIQTLEKFSSIGQHPQILIGVYWCIVTICSSCNLLHFGLLQFIWFQFNRHATPSLIIFFQSMRWTILPQSWFHWAGCLPLNGATSWGGTLTLNLPTLNLPPSDPWETFKHWTAPSNLDQSLLIYCNYL